MDLVFSASSCAAMPYCWLLVQPFLAPGSISRCLQPQLFVNGTFHTGSCLAMILALLDLSPMSATASGILLAAQLWVPAYFGIHLIDVLLNALAFVHAFDTHQTLSALFPADVQSLGVEHRVETSIYCEEFPGLHINSLQCPLWSKE